MPIASQRQITILPHIDVEAPIDLHDYVLISSKDISTWIPTAYERQVSALASLYTTVDHDITNVGLIIRKRAGNRLEKYSESELEQLGRVIDALAYSAHGKRHFRAAMRDNFRFTVLSFAARKAPSKYINIVNRRYSMHVIERKDHMLQIPLDVQYQTVNNSSFDEELRSALLRCSLSEREEDVRIMRAINWVNQSRTDTDSVSDYTRFLLIATAFEALLDTPDGSVRQYFMKTIQFLLGSSDELSDWSGEFYKLRSKLVHGERLPVLGYGKDKHNSIVTLADIVFYQCLVRKLGLMDYWPDHIDERIRREDVRKYLISNKKRFEVFRSFRLNSNVGASLTVYNHLHTIQRGDSSTSAADCKKALVVLLDLSLQGIRRLSRMKSMKVTSYKIQLQKYKTAFNNVLNQVNAGKDSNVYAEFRAISPDSADEWVDPSVRGTPFGKAGVIGLDDLMHAIREVDDLYTMSRYR